MQNQFLPIGSICTLVNNNKKVMIIGYNPQTYNGTIRSADYLGCTYPEGFLLPSMMTTFMESEISKVDFMGYKDDAYAQFVKSVSKETAPIEIPKREKEETIAPADKETAPTYQFDENGVVIVDPFASNLTPSEARPADYKFDAVADAKYAFDEDGMVIADHTVNENTASKPNASPSKSPYKFDENGVVIEDNSVVSEQTASAIANNQYKFDENGVIIEDNTVKTDNTNSTQSTPYEFDEDGMVIADRTAQAITNNQYKFDENGVVIEDNSSNNQMPKPNAGAMYEFDADGVIVADYSTNQENSQTVPEIKKEDIVPKYRFDENGVIIDDLTVEPQKETKSPFEFDKNGVIIADNTVPA